MGTLNIYVGSLRETNVHPIPEPSLFLKVLLVNSFARVNCKETVTVEDISSSKKGKN
jgi:hypothetical protein